MTINIGEAPSRSEPIPAADYHTRGWTILGMESRVKLRFSIEPPRGADFRVPGIMMQFLNALGDSVPHRLTRRGAGGKLRGGPATEPGMEKMSGIETPDPCSGLAARTPGIA